MLSAVRIIITTLLIIVLCACESDKTRRDRFFIMGNEALEVKRYGEAIENYGFALQIDPDFKEALNNRGVALAEDNRPQEAIQNYNEALRIDGEYFECIHNRAQAYEQIGRYTKSLEDYDRLIEEFPDSTFGYFGKGLVLTKMTKYSEAYGMFNKVMDISPQDVEPLINLGTLDYYLNRYEDGIDKLRSALEMSENPNAYNTLNQIYLAQGRLNDALDAIDAALDIVPGEPYFLNNRGFTFLMMDSLERGLKDINQSILIDPENLWAYRNKGIYFLLNTDFTQAITYFKDVVDSKIFVEDIYYYLGEAYFQKREIDQACKTWKIGDSKNEMKSRSRIEQVCN